MAVSDGDLLTVVKDQGLVAAVFDDRTLAGLDGHLAIGHCRYSTTGSSTWRNAQPAYRSMGERMFALGHNGNLVNTEALVAEAGMLEGTVTSDSDLIAELIAAELAHEPAPVDGVDDDGLERAVATVVTRLQGAFSLVIMTRPGSSACGTPKASGRCASGGSTAAGSWPPRRRRSTSSAPTSCASSSRARW
jgi:amidophosphoribosyltransferase